MIIKKFITSTSSSDLQKKDYVAIATEAESGTAQESTGTPESEAQVVDLPWKISSFRARNAMVDAVIMERLQRIEEKFDKHDTGTSKDHKAMSSELQKLRDENDYFKKQLSEIRNENLTIINCIKFNGTKNIQLLSIFGIAVTLFSLLISVLIKVHLMNPFLAILMLVASSGFYLMTRVEEKLQKNKVDKNV